MEGREKGAIEDVIGVLNLKGEEDQAQVYDLLFNKLRQVFQEYSGRVFDPKRSLKSAAQGDVQNQKDDDDDQKNQAIKEII